MLLGYCGRGGGCVFVWVGFCVGLLVVDVVVFMYIISFDVAVDIDIFVRVIFILFAFFCFS